MREFSVRFARWVRRDVLRHRWLLLGFALSLAFAVPNLRAQAVLRAVPDRIAYDVGEQVHVRIEFLQPNQLPRAPVDILGTVRYEGERAPLFQPIKLTELRAQPGALTATDYFALWKIPATAATGRYEVEIAVRNVTSSQPALAVPAAGSFEVYRKLVRIEDIELNRTFYTSGDGVSCRIKLRNLTHQSLAGLRVEFSDRYWPWIAGPAAAAAVSIVPLAHSLTLGPEAEEDLLSGKVAEAPIVARPSIHQYAVVVWDAARKTVLDIAFSRLVFVNPPGVNSPRPYPGQYIYPDLNSFHISTYRHFYPPALSPAIRFDASHTLFAAGSHGAIRFTVENPTAEPWRDISIRARLLGPAGNELVRRDVAASLTLDAGAKTPTEAAEFNFPEAAGLYRVVVDVSDASGNLLASNALELGINPLPKSILIFCAHEDDEGGYSGLARAAIENHIPIHYVYFTSGDAGSCDRYYERSCGPAEALQFGALRMDETRASLGHLGVPADDILFLGLPDGGSGEIWYYHHTAADPFLDPLLATDHAPYEGLVQPNLPFARDPVVEAVKKLILKFHPEVVCTAHPPSVGHIDHIVNNYLVVKALQELLREGTLETKPVVLVDRVYDPKHQPPTPYHYRQEEFYVSGEAAALAQESWWYYQSQGGNKAEGNLRPFDKLPRTEIFRRILDWDEHQGWNEKPMTAAAAGH